MIKNLHNYLFLVLLFVAVPCYGSDNNKSSWWFNGTWYPLDSAAASCGVLKFSGATLSGGLHSFLYSLEEIPISDFSVINSNDLIIIRATLKQKSLSGGEGLRKEVEYLIIRHFGLDDLSFHVCPDLQQVQKDIDKNTTGDYYCSNQAFSREQDVTDRDIEEKQKTFDDLMKLLSNRFDPEQIERFNQVQNEWKKDLRCACDKEVGEGLGPGLYRHIHVCEKNEIEWRLLLIREIVAGQQAIDYREPGLKSCAEIRAEEEASPEYQMIQAITNNDINTVKSLLKNGIKLSDGGFSASPTEAAIKNNNTEMLSFLLANGAEPMGMRSAIETCNIEMVSLLVDHGCQVKGEKIYISDAALFGCTDIIKYLVSKGADINFSGLLRRAVMMDCHVDTVKYFLSKGHDPDESDDIRTPLWHAAITALNRAGKKNACKTVINDLLQAGANPDRAFVVPTENPGLKLPRDDEEIMQLLRSSKFENNKN